VTPLVTLVVAMRNEADHIELCLQSLERQDYPPSKLEVLVMDGASTDRSWDLASAIVDRHPTWRLLNNPRRIQAAAWNLGISVASGDIIGILSGHAELGEDYVTEAVRTLDRTGAAMVGGPVRTIGTGPVETAIGAAMSSPFGVGGARHHYVEDEAETDTVFMGVSPRAIYTEHRFDETLVRNQDDELSYRLIDAGYRIVCNPAIRSRYRVRSSFSALWKQFEAYGYWKVAVLRRHPRRAKPRHLLPASVVLALAATAPLALVRPGIRRALLLAATPYLGANAMFAVRHGMRSGWRSAIAHAIAVPTMHTAYGAGFVRGLAELIGSGAHAAGTPDTSDGAGSGPADIERSRP